MIELKLSNNDTFCIELENAPKEIHNLISGIVRNQFMDSDDYRVSRNAGAFLQGGSNLTEGWILVEFWNPGGVEEFINYVNNKIQSTIYISDCIINEKQTNLSLYYPKG